MFTDICGSVCIFQLIRCWLLKLSRLKWFGEVLPSGCRAPCACVIPLSVLRDPRESQHISVEQLVLWDTWFSSQDRLLGAPSHRNLLSLGCKQSVSVQGEKKIARCAWNYLFLMSFRISKCADISQVVQGVLVILSTPWASCEKPPSNSTSGILKSCPVPQPPEAAPLDGKNVSALEVHGKCGF